MDSPCRRELLIAISLLQRAASLSLLVLAASEADKGTTAKADLSPVTIADFAIQALLAASLRAAFPADRLVGEETAAVLRASPALLERVCELLREAEGVEGGTRAAQRADVGDEGEAGVVFPSSKEEVCELVDWSGGGEPGGREGGRAWVFDPIDGTKAFVRGEMYAINLALLEGGKPILGAVALPLLSVDARAPVTDDSVDPARKGCLMFAVRGYGTWVRALRPSAGEVASPIRVEAHAEAVRAVKDLRCVTCFKRLDSGVDGVHEVIAQRLGVQFPWCDLLGWVPRWAVLALGLANMTVWVYKSRERRAKVWDHAGAMLLFEEVGGKITDVDGKEIDMGAGRTMKANFGFVAAPRNLHHIVLKTVQDVLREQGKGLLMEQV